MSNNIAPQTNRPSSLFAVYQIAQCILSAFFLFQFLQAIRTDLHKGSDDISGVMAVE